MSGGPGGSPRYFHCSLPETKGGAGFSLGAGRSFCARTNFPPKALAIPIKIWDIVPVR